MAQDGLELTGVEQVALDRLRDVIVDTRQQRAESVGTCMEALVQADEMTQLVARVCIEHYIDESSSAGLLEKPSPLDRDRAHAMAPGVFMAFRGLFDRIVETGEFLTTPTLAGAAESLSFKREKGVHASEFLFQWFAAQYPGSEAEESVSYYGLRSGRMSHNIHRGDFQTRNLLFHHSAVEKYLEMLHAGATESRAEIDPIIVLAGTDDWERATTLLTPTRRRLIV